MTRLFVKLNKLFFVYSGCILLEYVRIYLDKWY